MIPSNICMITLAILIPIQILIHHSHCAPLTFDVKESWCPGTQYSQNSTFQSNLNSLLNSMNSNSLTTNFFNGSVGRDTSNRVYGLYFCTGDLPQSDCRNCITTATSDVIQLCPTNREGIVWYDYCELRYSDQNFLGVLDSRGTNLTNPFASLPDPSQPLEVVTQLVREAPFNKPLMFAYNSSASDEIYALAQCTNDLNSTSCSNCLNDILGKIKTCCSRARGWRYLAVSCWVRYEATPFLKNLNVPTEINEYQCSSDDFERTENVVMNQNLRSLLSILPSNASVGGFYNTSMGNNNNVIYGSGLCRADVSSSLDCLNCLNMSANGLLRDCPDKTRGFFWFEKCLVRYSNRNFFGIVDDDGRTYCNEQNTTLEANDAIVGLMSRLIEIAPNKPLMFASGNVSISSTLASFGLVQCSRDLSSDSCKNCLTTGLKNVSDGCKQRKGWRYLSGSCTLRYEDFQFFNVSSSVVTNPPQKDNKGKSTKVVIAGVTTAILGAILFASIAFVMWKKKKRKARAYKKHQLNASDSLIEREFQLMDIETAKSATNHFAETNKLGEGGFGPVYKGVLADGTEVAIKRLSSNSGQGAEEFKNEVKLIAKLQHKNLVKLLGCCVENGEKLLVYEYLPNGSLDTFLVDPSKRSELDWETRKHIVLGITRGLIYLHEDSQLKVVHRDLKPSNILLDVSMSPKISDFGMARIFNNDENEANTKRVVGTLGYMAPEFAMAGLFSAKSDVFGFGVLLLEIISGQRNGHSHFQQHDQSLLIRAWNLWKEEKGQDLVDQLVDPSIAGTFPTSEAVRWIQIGLLCVQENPADRLKMSMVLRMFETEQMVLKEPNQPPSFMWEGVAPPQENSSKTPKYTSANEITVTDVEAR